MPTTAKTGPKSNRSETLNVRLSPKHRYLAELAARHQDRSLSSFVDYCIRRVLTGDLVNEESLYSGNQEQVAPVMWGEGLWDDDHATRLFLLGIGRRDLMSVDEARMFNLINGSIVDAGEKVNLSRFREVFNRPALDKTHLEKDGDA